MFDLRKTRDNRLLNTCYPPKKADDQWKNIRELEHFGLAIAFDVKVDGVASG